MMVPLGEAIGRSIRCPDAGCGAPAWVEKGRNRPAGPGGMPPPPGAAPSDQVVAPSRWCLVICPRTGAKSFPVEELVEVLDG